MRLNASPLALAAAVLLLGASAASAERLHMRRASFATVRTHHFVLTRGFLDRIGFRFRREGFAFDRSRFFRGQGFFPGTFFGDGSLFDPVPQETTQSPPVIVVAAPPPPPPPPPAEQHATIETTPQGVTIFRGPGSHHFAP